MSDRTRRGRLQPERLLTPAEVAALFGVDAKTVTRWAKAGKLSALRTLGGHRRYREADIRAILQGSGQRRRPVAGEDSSGAAWSA